MRLSKSGARLSTYRGVVAPLTQRRVCAPRSRRMVGVTVAGVGSYLAEAFVQIFSVPDDQDIDWSKVAKPFTGRITHHEEKRLRRLYSVVQAVKGCTDETAQNYDPDANIDDGSCVYDPGAEPVELKSYLQGALQRVFGNNFKGDDTEPEWVITPFSGRIKSRREIDKMVWFEKVVSKTLDEAQKED